MPSLQEIGNTLQGLRAQFQGAGEGAEGLALQAMSDYARSAGIDPNTLAQAANSIAPNAGSWDANRVQQTMAQYGPQTGPGLKPAMSTISGAQQNVSDLYKQGLTMLQPYMQAGTKANDLQAALSGALGPEAQAKAFADYQTSPGVKFAQQEAERALLRNASATGGLGGGNVLRDLTQLAAGTAMQDFGNQFQRIGDVADRGYGASTTGAGLMGQQAGLQAGLSQTGSGYQFQAGRDISSAVQNTTSSLAQLLNQQGAGMADITGNTVNNVNSIYQNALNGDAAAKEQLASLLANLSMSGANSVAGLGMIQQPNTGYLGQLGQLASGIGGLYAGLNYGGTA